MADRAAPDPFAGGLPVLDGVARGGTAPRVRLRPLRQPGTDGGTDLDALFVAFSDPETLRYWSHEPFATREQAAEYLAGIDAGSAGGSLFQWAIADAATDALLGTLTLYAWDRTHRRAEIGFLLGRAHWGRGLASEALRTALTFAFGPMNLHRIEADVDPDNAASLALLARLGFREEGRLAERWFTFGAWHDTILLGLLASDYDVRASDVRASGAAPPTAPSEAASSGGQIPSVRRSETT